MAERDWVASALCAQVATDLWFPAQGRAGDEAKAICDACPVRLECLQYALDTGQEYGVWGGLGTRERRRLLRERRRGDAPRAPVMDSVKVQRAVSGRIALDRLNEAEKDAAVGRLAGWGSAVAVAHRLGCNERTVQRIRARLRERDDEQHGDPAA